MERNKGKRCVVRYIVMCFILGAYEPATTIAPPKLRYHVYGCKDDTEFVHNLILTRLNSRELYSMISEFIVCLSQRHSALYHALSYIKHWDMYEKTCLRVCNDLLRRRIYGVCKYTNDSPTMPVLNRTYYKHHKIGQLHDSTSKMRVKSLLQLCSIMNIRTRIPPVIIERVGGHEHACKIYKIASNADNSCAIQAPILKAMGLEETKIKLFKSSVQGCDVKHTKRVTRVLTKLSKSDVAILHLYLHAIVERLRLTITPAQHQTAHNNECTALVCGECYTLRSKARGLLKTVKGGILIDIQRPNAVICSSCYSDKIMHVKLNNRIITAPMTSDGNMISLSICVRCHNPMALHRTSIIGIHPICTACLVKVKAEMTPTHCFCGALIQNRGKSTKMFMAYNEENLLSLYAACEKHEYSIPDREIVNINVIRACIGNKLQKAKATPRLSIHVGNNAV